MHIGQAIRAARLEKDLTQSALAQRSGISNAYLSQIEAGKQEPSLDTLEKICQALDVPAYVLLFKAVEETEIKDPDKKRFVREIKNAMKGIVEELYAEHH